MRPGTCAARSLASSEHVARSRQQGGVGKRPPTPRVGGLRPSVRALWVTIFGRWAESTPVAWPPGKLDAGGSGVAGSRAAQKTTSGRGTDRSRSLRGGSESRRKKWVGERAAQASRAAGARRRVSERRVGRSGGRNFTPREAVSIRRSTCTPTKAPKRPPLKACRDWGIERYDRRINVEGRDHGYSEAHDCWLFVLSHSPRVRAAQS